MVLVGPLHRGIVDRSPMQRDNTAVILLISNWSHSGQTMNRIIYYCHATQKENTLQKASLLMNLIWRHALAHPSFNHHCSNI